MKSLVTQEMSKQNGSRSRSPNIIARLMGLDWMPPHTSLHREPKPAENQQRRPIKSGKARGKDTYGDHESVRRGSMDEQRCKDVFEVLDAEKEKSSSSLRQRKVDASLNEAEMAFIRQKFIEAKRLSADEKLRYSKEFNETLEALDSNKDLLSKLLHHPDSLFTKHLPDLQSIAPKPHCSQATTLKVDGELLEKSHRSPQWHGGLKPTEIVVLKPNLGKPQTTGSALPSQSSSCDEVRADLRLPCTSNRESKAFGSLKANEDVSLVRLKPRDSRAIARIVSRQMKGNSGSDSSMNFEISRFRGSAGDESGSDSSRARTDFNRKNHHRSLPSRSPESSVSKETMRRLSERWKLAHKSEREIEIRRSNTLAEMLATSYREARPTSFNEITLKKGISKRVESNVGQCELLEPIGISSRDGWKGTGRRKLSKRRTIMHEDRTRGHTIVLPKKLITRDGLVKESSFHHREFFLSNDSTPVSTNSSLEINRASSSKILHMDGEFCGVKLPALKTQSNVSVHADSKTESGSDYEDAKSTPFLEQLDFSAVTVPDNSSRPNEEVDHSSIPQLQLQESAKEGEQPSAVSILQTSCHDEFSFSSECFESLNADLQGLRMKLQLLKRESATYKEGDMLVSSDEDADQEESSTVTDESLITQEPGEDWKSLYLADVLANSRFSDLNLESFVATWHSSESPVDPSLFEFLEKKYSGLKTSTRLERKLLLDRIKSEILEISEQHPKWDINRIHETLSELVTRRKDMKPSRYTKEKEIQWPNLEEDDIEVIGKEIEEMLTGELIAELV